MSLTFNTLSERLANLELEVGVGEQWPRKEAEESVDETSLADEVAELQAKVNSFFQKHTELSGLPDAIRQYREDPGDLYSSNANDRVDDGETREQSTSEISVNQNITSAEKQERVLVEYPSIMECYNLLMEFSEMDIPSLSGELADALDLKSIIGEKMRCENIARKFHLLVVKNIIILEEFTEMIKHQHKISQNFDKRMGHLSSRVLSLERQRREECKY